MPRIQFTETQERLWKILEQNSNQALSIRKICKLAGYRTVTPWYDAIQDESFRAMVQALGVVIQRQHPPRLQRVACSVEDAEAEWQKDVIDIRRFMADYPKHWPAGNFRLDFSCMRNPQLKQLVKRYFRARLGFWESITFNHTLVDMKPFLIALGNRYPALESFAPLTREMVEPLLTLPTWVDGQGRTQVISPQRKGAMVSKLNIMFSYMQQHGWEGAPTHPLIYDEDCPKRPKRRPRPLPQKVLERRVGTQRLSLLSSQVSVCPPPNCTCSFHCMQLSSIIGVIPSVDVILFASEDALRGGPCGRCGKAPTSGGHDLHPIRFFATIILVQVLECPDMMNLDLLSHTCRSAHFANLCEEPFFQF